MSTQLKEKQQSKSKEQTPSRELQADFHFNQHIFRTVAYTAAGFGVGLLSSLLFKHKAGMTIFFAGAGAGYGSADFVNELNGFRSKRNPTQINKREGNASSQIKDQLQRTGDNLKGDLQQAKNKVERGVEDVSGKVAGQINQTARGAEEWARNASEKASQHFQQKNHSRGGDDDKDDSKSGKKDQQQTQKKDQKQQDTQKKDQPKKEDQHRQQDNQKKEKESGANATLKGGLSESAHREQGSKDHKLIGDNIRIDQYTNKIHDQDAFTGYNSPKQQWEGVKDKKEDKSVGGQGKSAADKNQTVNKGGQHFQDFHSNPNEAGKTTKVSDAKQDYQRNRNRAQEDNLDLQNRMRAQKHLQQDKHGESTHQGNNIRVDTESETKQGFQNYKTGVAPSLAKNQVNATLE